MLALLLLMAVPLHSGCKSELAPGDPSPTPAPQNDTAWVFLRHKADLSPAFGMKDWNARGRFVVEQLQGAARTSQSDLSNTLRNRGVEHQSFWLINAVRVKADDATLKELAQRPDVARVLRHEEYRIPTPRPGSRLPSPEAIEWNVARIRAPEVWSSFGTRGEGIVIGSIDTGIQFDHPALARQYRGHNPDGTVDHNYNWFDPSSVCGSPSLAPCDNTGHGTHTMGTMVGDDGSGNQIGVAPGVRWMTAKGCEDLSCSTEALLAAGQWMLAPTDLSGNNPRPDLRPHIINNSWGDGPEDPFFQPIVQAWVASGIFPAFAVGNFEPTFCGSVSAPAAYPESYGVGAFDINGNIASFSGRGPSAFGGISKPDVAAPGVDVRSSVPGGYDTFSGTSMATPHVAATVALMWSAAPSLAGDVATTRGLLDASAVDREDLGCGGTAADNNIWGEGQLDALAAVERSPTGPSGIVHGVVTDAATGAPLAGARVVAEGPFTRETSTDEEGRYSLTLPVGTYRVSATFFGYERLSVDGVEVTEGSDTRLDFPLRPVPVHTVSGRVLDASGAPIAFARVTLLGTPFPSTLTDAAGIWRFERVPEGEYDVQVSADGCFLPRTVHLVVDGDETLDVVLESRTDAYGYSCRYEPPAYVEATTPLPLSGDDSSVQVDLPFLFTLYGRTYGVAHVATNGHVNFLAPNPSFFNEALPSPNLPNAAIYALWDDLFVDGESSVRTLTRGAAPTREFVIEWHNVSFLGEPSLRVDFEIILSERGGILLQYRNISDNTRERGDSATVGIENETGTIALQYSLDTPSLRDERAIRFTLPPNGFVEGVVTDANDGQPLSGATVRALEDGRVAREVTTGEDGRYRLQLFLGTYTLEASAPNYVPETGTVTISTDGQVVRRDWALRTARAELEPTVLEFIVPRGERRTRYLTLRNTGSAPLEWTLRETGGGRTGVVSRRGLTRGLTYDPNSHTTRNLFGDEPPPGWAPTLVGDVLRSWPATGLELPWGVGYTGNVWLSDPPSKRNHEFTVDGMTTGRNWMAPWAGDWPADMAYDEGRGLMCQVNVGGDNGIYCWDPATGNVVDSITGTFPWTATSQRGLAYRPDDDTFYVGGWNEGILYHVKGLSHPDKGAVIGQCSPADGSISGLAWNAAFGVIWVATNSPSDTLYELNPDTCTVLASLAHPTPGFNGAGLELDEEGNLWTVSQASRQAYLIESGVPAFTDVPWLSERPESGTLPVGGTQRIAVTVDTSGLEPGIYHATLFLRSNSGRSPSIPVRIVLIVPAYYQGVNVGDGTYVDLSGNVWAADQRFSSGSWGYVDSSRTVRTRSSIRGTEDDPLYQTGRRGFFEYRFEGLAPGVYQIDLRFAEIQGERRLERVYDVVAEQTLLLPAHDIAGEVGSLTADDHSFFLEVTDGQLNLRFIPRKGYGEPLVNAIRVFQRPDR